MNTKTLRLFVIASLFLLVGVMTFQYRWFKEAYNQEDRDFDLRVTNALRVVTKRVLQYNKNPNNMVLKPVERISSNYFTVQINDQISPVVLEEFLSQEFVNHEVRENFEYGVYDCVKNRIVYGGYVCHSENCDSTRSVKYQFPQIEGYNYYFGVYFPERAFNLLNELGNWFVSSAILFIVLIFFAYALWVIFRQKRISEIQTDFINNMTHEFKTPIATISISSEVLMKPDIVQNPERLLSYATIIRKEASRLKKNVDTVLQTANISQKIDKLNFETVDVDEVLTELVEGLEPILKEKSAKIQLHLGAENTLIQADRLHFTNVLHNLIDNSLKYCETQPQIAITTQNKNNQLVISVKDNGIGIPEKNHRQVFDKFFRVHTGDVHNVKGFGLGLYYVKEMIEGHKGKITLKSNIDEGCEFILTLPVV